MGSFTIPNGEIVLSPLLISAGRSVASASYLSLVLGSSGRFPFLPRNILSNRTPWSWTWLDPVPPVAFLRKALNISIAFGGGLPT
ncbi:hypothetical protein V2G26_012122 [Clonostachys chloroleuca]